MNTVTEIAHGLIILGEWLGDGGNPVKRDLAETRSKVCEKCPLNSHGKWWETAKDSIAASIRKIIEVKHHMSIRVSNENKLFMCSACGCATMLKVHTPLKHVLNHTSEENLSKLDPGCWILSDSK